MAQYTRAFSNGTYAANWRVTLDYWVGAQEVGNNRSYIELRNYVYSISPTYRQWGNWDGRVYVNGGEVNRNTPYADVSSGWYLLNAWGGWVGHDVNGNLSITVGNYVNAPVNEANHVNIGWGLPRIALAPGIAAISVDTIKPTAARLGIEITGHGHGTSSAMRMYYRKSGTAGWSQTADQGDVGGYNYWTVTGLKPNTNYEYFGRVWNNNGDTADSGVQSFKTQSVAGMTPILLELIA